MTSIAELGIQVKTTGVTKAERELEALEKQTGQTERQVSSLGATAGKALGIAVVAGTAVAVAGLQKYVRNTIEAEKVQAQLAARIKSSHSAAGLAIGDLNKMADALQNATTFDDEAIGGAQSLLLTFTKIGRDVFPKATEAVLDMSTALGTDLNNAALQVGKALNDPVKGVTALARAGVQFSESQKDTIKQLVETNKLAEAQAIILKELETQMGGSARAARNTLGGALTALGNSFDNLLEGDAGDGGVKGTRDAIEGLTKTLNDPAIKRGVDSTATGLLTIASSAVELIAKLGDAGSALAEFFADNEDKSNASLQNRRNELETQLFGIERYNRGSLPFLRQDTSKQTDEIAEIDRILSDRSRRSMFEGVSVRVDSTAFRSASGEDEDKKKKRTKATKELTEAQKAFNDQEEVYALLVEESDKAIRELFFSRQDAAEALAEQAAERDANNRGLIADMEFELSLIGMTNVERAKAIALRQLEADATQEQINAVAALAEEMERSRDQIAFMDDARANLSDMFQDVITGAKSAKDAIKGFFDDLFESAARAASDQLVQQLFGSFGSNGGGSAGGDWFGAIASMFGGGRAIGGPVSANKVYEVGERGPEVLQMHGRTFMIPGAPGKVTPMAAAPSLMPQPVNMTFHVAGSVDPRSATQIAQETERHLRTATRRNG
jgi:hypothetical protein